jgi:hypothetical protein
MIELEILFTRLARVLILSLSIAFWIFIGILIGAFFF